MKHSRSLTAYASSPPIALTPTLTRLTVRRRSQQSPESHTFDTFCKTFTFRPVCSSATPSSTLRLTYNAQNSRVHAYGRSNVVSEPQITNRTTEPLLRPSLLELGIQFSKNRHRPAWAMHRMTESGNPIVRRLILFRKTTSRLFVEGRIGSSIEVSHVYGACTFSFFNTLTK